VRDLPEEPGQEPLGRQRTRDVRDHDRDPVARADYLPKRRGRDRRPHRVLEGARLVRQSRHETRLDHRDGGRVRRELEPVPSILQAYPPHGHMIP
jgi:hypothetical protein